MTGPIVNLNELEFETVGNHKRFVAKRAPVSSRIGAEKLGYAVIEVPPGKSAWPYHAHREIEEMFLILEGTGTLRQAGKEYPVSKGDFICCPANPGQPHQLTNSSGNPLTYLALSNQVSADVMHYPDSGKFGVWQGDGSDPSGPGSFVAFVKDTGEAEVFRHEALDCCALLPVPAELRRRVRWTRGAARGHIFERSNLGRPPRSRCRLAERWHWAIRNAVFAANSGHLSGGRLSLWQ